MPSVRDILRGTQPDKSTGQQQGLGGGGLQAGGDDGQQLNQQQEAALIADRLRQAAEQRAALAQKEIERLNIHMEQLQERMVEFGKQNVPVAELKRDMDEVALRISEAKSDLARAQEARLNTEFATGAGESHHTEQSHHDHHGQSAGKPTVRATLGGKTNLPLKPGGSKLKL